MNEGALPVALRNVMKSKFAEFNEYSLAKHNKEGKGGTEKEVAYVPASDDDDEEDEVGTSN